MPSLSHASFFPLLLLTAGFHSSLQAQQNCSSLLKDPPAGIHLTTAALVPAGAQIASNAKTAALTGAAKSTAGFPEHCQIQGQLEARTSPQGGDYAIGFELRLPTRWNGGLSIRSRRSSNGNSNVARPTRSRPGERVFPDAHARSARIRRKPITSAPAVWMPQAVFSA